MMPYGCGTYGSHRNKLEIPRGTEPKLGGGGQRSGNKKDEAEAKAALKKIREANKVMKARICSLENRDVSAPEHLKIGGLVDGNKMRKANSCISAFSFFEEGTGEVLKKAMSIRDVDVPYVAQKAMQDMDLRKTGKGNGKVLDAESVLQDLELRKTEKGTALGKTGRGTGKVFKAISIRAVDVPDIAQEAMQGMELRKTG